MLRDDPNSHRELASVRLDFNRDELIIGRPQRLFDAPSLGIALTNRGFRSYDVAADGQQFIVRTLGEEGRPVITMIENFSSWVERQRQ